MLILIGSKALEYYTKLDRTPKDIDVVGDYDEIINRYKTVTTKACYPINQGKKVVLKSANQIVEGEITWPGSTAEELKELVSQDMMTSCDTINRYYIPSIDVLYMLKMSHRYLKNSPHFLKTMKDIRFMRTWMRARIRPEHEQFLKRREKETYDYSHPSLAQSKGNFFSGDGVKYVYDHDSIHEAVAIGDAPAYRLYQKDGAEVACDKEKWNALPRFQKLFGVLEEAYVLALERSQIPYKGQVDPKKSFDMALMKICTSITSGWFREFAWENYDEVRELYDNHYVSNFNLDVLDGKVKPYATNQST